LLVDTHFYLFSFKNPSKVDSKNLDYLNNLLRNPHFIEARTDLKFQQEQLQKQAIAAATGGRAASEASSVYSSRSCSERSSELYGLKQPIPILPFQTIPFNMNAMQTAAVFNSISPGMMPSSSQIQPYNFGLPGMTGNIQTSPLRGPIPSTFYTPESTPLPTMTPTQLAQMQQMMFFHNMPLQQQAQLAAFQGNSIAGSSASFSQLAHLPCNDPAEFIRLNDRFARRASRVPGPQVANDAYTNNLAPYITSEFIRLIEL
jgi:hypothetical protein